MMLNNCITVYENLIRRHYILTLENDVVLELSFKPSNFYHLLGLEKLSDISQLNINAPARNAGKVYLDLKKEKRLRYFDQIPGLLQSSKIIVDFDRRLLKNENGIEYSKLYHTKYILYRKLDCLDCAYLHLTIGQKEPSCSFYPETFFYEASKRYISGQELLDIKDVQAIPIQRKRF